MKDCNYKPDGTGVVMGDTKAMPSKGTTTGMSGYPLEDDGKSIGEDATNTIGKITGATDSNPADQCKSADPTFGHASDKASY